MKDNLKFRPTWTVSSIVRRFVPLPRGGIKQQAYGNFLFLVVIAILTVCVIWGPTVSPAINHASRLASVIPAVNYELVSSSNLRLEEKISTHAADKEENSHRVGKEKVSFNESETEEKPVVVDERKISADSAVTDAEEHDHELQVVEEKTSLDEADHEKTAMLVVYEKKNPAEPKLTDSKETEFQALHVEEKVGLDEAETDHEEKPVADQPKISADAAAVVTDKKEDTPQDVVEEKVHPDEDVKEEKPKVIVKETATEKKTSLNSRQNLNAPFSFSPKYTHWDKQRAAYLRKNSSLRSPIGRKSRVMLITNTSPLPCNRTAGTFLYIMSAKNKLDYTRMHDIQFYYDMANVDPNLDGSWTKLALIRMLMVNHPEVDWFWWMNSDAWITDMAFEIPFDKYAADGKNLFLYGDQNILFNERNWLGISTGDFGIRNCQWSLDLLDAWASFGVKETRDESGKFLTHALPGRPEGFAADDQSALAYLLIHQKKKWEARVALERSYTLSGDWTRLTTQYEELMQKYHPGFGDDRWPLAINFAGCQQCSGIDGNFPWETCFSQMLRTYDFADSQVLHTMGFKLEGSLGGGAQVLPLHGKQPDRVEGELYHIHPNISDWDQQRAAYLKKRNQKSSKPRVLLVSGSGARECRDVRGTHFLLKALKNKIDYARMHDLDFFYNMDNLDKELTGWWMKIPIIRAMMLAHPEDEWIWWVDSDAVFTDMVFLPPFESYKDVNLVLWGDHDLVYKARSFVGINAGIMIVRNCQWSLDLFDSFIPMGPNGNVRDEYGKMLTKFMTQRPDMGADDQSAIVYILNTQKEKYGPKTFFENSYAVSGSWEYITKDFEKLMAEYQPGTGDWRCPLITHFAGCQPCSGYGNYDYQECLNEMDRSLHFADNQILRAYNLQHPRLSTWEIQRLESDTSGAENKTVSQTLPQEVR